MQEVYLCVDFEHPSKALQYLVEPNKQTIFAISIDQKSRVDVLRDL